MHVALRARLEGDTVAYHILVDSHEPELVKRMIVKGAVPANAIFVDSWAGSPYLNRGVFDGSVVTWYDPDAQLNPGQDRREYVFIVRPQPGVSRAEVRTTAWVQFSEPAPGVAMSNDLPRHPEGLCLFPPAHPYGRWKPVRVTSSRASAAPVLSYSVP